MNSENLVEITDLAFAYGTHQIFRDVNLRIPRGSIVGIMGTSGSGKTTLMRLIGGQLRPARGEVRVMGKVVHTLDRGGLFEAASEYGVALIGGLVGAGVEPFSATAAAAHLHGCAGTVGFAHGLVAGDLDP